MIRIIYLVSFLLISCSGEYSSDDNSQYGLTDNTRVDLLSPGKVIVINYWATWCSPCRKEIPELNELKHQLVLLQRRHLLLYRLCVCVCVCVCVCSFLMETASCNGFTTVLH